MNKSNFVSAKKVNEYGKQVFELIKNNKHFSEFYVHEDTNKYINCDGHYGICMNFDINDGDDVDGAMNIIESSIKTITNIMTDNELEIKTADEEEKIGNYIPSLYKEYSHNRISYVSFFKNGMNIKIAFTYMTRCFYGLNVIGYVSFETPKVEKAVKQYVEHPEINVGTIFYGSFGYDMTIPVFYQVIERNNSTVKYVELNSAYEEDSNDYVTPLKDSFANLVYKTARIQESYGSTYIKTNFCHAFVWDGKAKYINTND